MQKKIIYVVLFFSLLLTMLSSNVLGNNNVNTENDFQLTNIESDESTNYLNFTAIGGDITFCIVDGATMTNLEYSYDKTNWVDYTSGGAHIELLENNTAYLRLKPGLEAQWPCGNQFFIVDKVGSPNNAKVKAAGNIMSLVSSDCSKTTIDVENAFNSLFSDCNKLLTPPELPATTLSNNCYSYMFYFCTSLETAPVLPATILADYCYDNMFNNCTSLTNAPNLPALECKNSCYGSMFFDCKSLKLAPELPAKTLADSCYKEMFYLCESLINPPSLPATSLSDCCYELMFGECTSLVSTPVLTAKVATQSCYHNMFFTCTSLKSVSDIYLETTADQCCKSMFNGCAMLEKVPNLYMQDTSPGCCDSMFLDCSALKEAPELPASSLNDSCYMQMFDSCSNLKKINVNFNEWNDDEYSTDSWLSGVAESGVFICPEGLDTSKRDASHVPEGWNIKRNYCVTSTNPDHGEICTTVDSKKFTKTAEGDVVDLEYSSQEGYSLGEWSVTTANGLIIDVENNKFVMPGDDVFVTASEIEPPQPVPDPNPASVQTGDIEVITFILLFVVALIAVIYIRQTNCKD